MFPHLTYSSSHSKTICRIMGYRVILPIESDIIERDMAIDEFVVRLMKPKKKESITQVSININFIGISSVVQPGPRPRSPYKQTTVVCNIRCFWSRGGGGVTSIVCVLRHCCVAPSCFPSCRFSCSIARTQTNKQNKRRKFRRRRRRRGF